jgi:hypothetical protein
VSYFYFVFEQYNQIEHLFDFLYRGVDETMYLAREYQMFADFLRQGGLTIH